MPVTTSSIVIERASIQYDTSTRTSPAAIHVKTVCWKMRSSGARWRMASHSCTTTANDISGAAHPIREMSFSFGPFSRLEVASARSPFSAAPTMGAKGISQSRLCM